MTRNAVIFAMVSAALVSGCATTAAGLADAEVDASLTSDKAPREIALCAAESFNGNPKLGNDGDHYWLTRSNTYGATVTRWDFRPRQGGGTDIELRASIPVNSGDEKVRACA